MKKLFVIRHAKSSWKDYSLADFDRPLNKRGFLNAPFMGEYFKDRDIVPDIILSSPALRAKTTAEIIANKVKYKKQILYEKSIYEADIDTLHNILTSLDNKYKSAFIVGHNPGLNLLVDSYVGFDENIPTCGVVELQIKSDSWKNINSKNIKLLSFNYPKKLNKL